MAEEPDRQDSGRLPNGQFAPGFSGNPAGPKVGTVSVVAALRRRLKAHPEELDEIVENLVELAKQRDVQALKAVGIVLDRIDGGVAKIQEIEVKGPTKLVELVDTEEEDGTGD